MGQKISSPRLTSSVSPNQPPHHHPCVRRLSLGSLEESRSFRSLSCLKRPEELKRSYICPHNSLYARTFQRSKSQDREPSSLVMASQQYCNCVTHCTNCTAPTRHTSEHVQNGNTVDGATSNNTCVKSSSVERYMSALTERADQTFLTNKCFVQSSSSNSESCVCSDSLKVRTKPRNKVVTSKSCSKQLERTSVTSDCFACVRDAPKERFAGKSTLKKKRWVPKFHGSKLSKNGGKISVSDAVGSTDSGLDIAGSSNDSNCICTLYRKMEDSCKITTQHNIEATSSNSEGNSGCMAVCRRLEGDVGTGHNLINLPINITVSRVGQPMYSALLTTASSNTSNAYGTLSTNILFSVGTQNTPFIDLRLSAEEYPVEDCEERARVLRAWEIAEGVEPPPGYRPHIQVFSGNEVRALFLQKQSRIHTQVDFIHCLVPDLKAINQCSFYWGKMDRYEAERLLEGKPEGTFFLRDSAQEDYLFSVSFRKYGRSLHARIEQFNHKFSFDSHDPGVYAASTVTGLIEHYKDPACVMFFEPMLTAPLSRTYVFPLQHICRAVIASCTTYDGINELRLPTSLKTYLKEYHYRQRVRVKRFEGYPEGFWGPGEAL